MRENGECHVGNKFWRFWHDLALTTDNCNLSLLLSLPKIIAKTKLSAHTAFPTSENFSQMKSLLLSSSPASPASLSKTNSENDALFGHHEINSSSSHCYFLSVHNRNHSAPPLRARLDTRFSYSTPKRLRSVKFVFVAKAADSTQPSTSVSTSSSDKTLVSDEGFSLSKISFGVVGLGVGISLLSYGFGAYFNILPGSEWSAIMLTYGFPLAIIGMALKYAELKPVPCITYADALALRETSATPILKQVRSDVTRYRYGDEQHLDEALKRIFQYGLGGGIPRRSAPILQKMREEVTEEGKYSLVLVFEAKDLKLSDFEQRQAKFASFFGPDITAEVGKAEDNLYEVKLISNLTAKASSS